ncbi:hypothetical protein [Halorarum salinum]|uniref:Uncharacterized protein n=1 Tax=Halorarum salinum TaxID=2743089 RepID=A0A7D5LBL6_9EURY|nr:hypothetical protein [Halobaculum salinum]QLG62215.1 hypothetical protein HUG12_10925 [Halobaculum salinum]
MKAGVIHIAESDTRITDFQKAVELPDGAKFDSVTEAIEVDREIGLEDNSVVQQGKVAVERIVEVDDPRIREDGIAEYTDEEKVVQVTDFLYHPGKFFAVSSSAGNFAIEVLRNHSSISITPSNFNVDEFIERKNSSNGDANPWKIGFYDNLGSAENGVVHGDSLLHDEVVGDTLNAAKKNQIGLDYEFNSLPIRMFASETSYVEIYQPSNFSTEQYTKYVIEEIIPHLEAK